MHLPPFLRGRGLSLPSPPLALITRALFLVLLGIGLVQAIDRRFPEGVSLVRAGTAITKVSDKKFDTPNEGFTLFCQPTRSRKQVFAVHTQPIQLPDAQGRLQTVWQVDTLMAAQLPLHIPCPERLEELPDAGATLKQQVALTADNGTPK